MPTTVSRSRGRQGVHSGAQGAAGDHVRKIMATLIAATAVIIFVLVGTTAGHTIDAATQHFMLYYAGVLALVGLTGSVLMGLVATDRIVMTPGHRVMAQAVHRAFAFGTLAFLIIHIATEILAQRSHVIDAAIPFLSPYRTFYIGLGTIASDLIVLLVVTSILRKRFTGHGRAWRWRAIHYSSYVAFVFAVLHGLLGGRAAKPYVDWSYGFAIAITALGLAVRFLAISLRPKETLGSPPSVDRARPSGSSPLHAAAMSAAAMSMTQAQLGGTVQVLPVGMGARDAGIGAPGTGPWAALPAPGWSPSSGPLQALDPAPAYAGPSSSSGAYRELGFTPLGAPPYGDDVPNGMRGRPYLGVDQPRSAPPGPAPAGPARPARQPLYEPGYDGPPRFEGAPRGHGDVPQDELSSYPYGPPGRRPQPRRRISTTTPTVPDPTRAPVRGPAGRSPRVPARQYPPRLVRKSGVRGRCQRPGQARCLSSDRGRCPGLKGWRCPGLIPARFLGSAMTRPRATARAPFREMAPARCHARVARCHARVRDPCRVPTRAPCPGWSRARCPGPTPARCLSSDRDRCLSSDRDRCLSSDRDLYPGLIPARCHARVRDPCPVRTRDPCHGSGPVRCPGLTRARCPGQTPGRCRVSTRVRFRGPGSARCRAWAPVPRPVRTPARCLGQEVVRCLGPVSRHHRPTPLPGRVPARCPARRPGRQAR